MTEKRQTKAAALAEFRLRMGKCAAMTEGKDPHPCDNWATDSIGSTNYCGTHIKTLYADQVESERVARRKRVLDAVIDAHMAWVQDHPSIWDSKRT